MLWLMTDYGRGERRLELPQGAVFPPSPGMVLAMTHARGEARRLGLVPGGGVFIGQENMERFRRLTALPRPTPGKDARWFMAPVKSFDDPRFDKLLDVGQRAADNKPTDQRGEIVYDEPLRRADALMKAQERHAKLGFE